MDKQEISKEELKAFKSKIEAVVKLGVEQEMLINQPTYTIVRNPLDIVLAVSIDLLYKSSEALNRLTKALIILTVVLAILTGLSVWKLFYP